MADCTPWTVLIPVCRAPFDTLWRKHKVVVKVGPRHEWCHKDKAAYLVNRYEQNNTWRLAGLAMTTRGELYLLYCRRSLGCAPVACQGVRYFECQRVTYSIRSLAQYLLSLRGMD